MARATSAWRIPTRVGSAQTVLTKTLVASSRPFASRISPRRGASRISRTCWALACNSSCRMTWTSTNRTASKANAPLNSDPMSSSL